MGASRETFTNLPRPRSGQTRRQEPLRQQANPLTVEDDPIERIQRLRNDIARIDQQILALVSWRLDVAEQIGHNKKLAGLPVRNFQMEVDVLRRAREACADFGLDPDVGQSLFQVLIEAAVGRQHGLVERPHEGPRRTVLVVGGGGRMGRWLCGYFAAQGHQVAACDPLGGDLETRRVADLLPAAHDADIVVLATPIGVTTEVLDEVLAARPRGLVFDICSLKTPLVKTLERGTREGLRVASLHPMFAPDTVLLSGRVLVVCDCGNPQAAAEARALFEDTALRIVDMPLEQHDRSMGYVLGLSHAVNIAFARALATSGLGLHELERVSSTTFAKQSRTTREVAHENPKLYYEIQHLNAHTAEVLQGLSAAVDELRIAALGDEAAPFIRLMDENRRYFDGLASEPGGPS